MDAVTMILMIVDSRRRRRKSWAARAEVSPLEKRSRIVVTLRLAAVQHHARAHLVLPIVVAASVSIAIT